VKNGLVQFLGIKTADVVSLENAGIEGHGLVRSQK
jgi:hypothetical protein